jgi:hypothetical protein
MPDIKHKCGPGYGTRGERAYNLRVEGKTWLEVAGVLEMPDATPETNIESAATNAARKYARSKNLPWPVPRIPSPAKPKSVLPDLHALERKRQEEAYATRLKGLGWFEVAEETGYTCLSHAIAGAKRYAVREGKPWPIQIASSTPTGGVATPSPA